MLDFDEDDGVSIVDVYMGDQGFKFDQRPKIETADELEFQSSTFMLAPNNWANGPFIDY